MDIELQPFYKMRFNVRPVKHAFLVAEGDSVGFSRAAMLSGTQWGGIQNLIIPVGNDGSLHWMFAHLLTLNEPDRFISFLTASSSGQNMKLLSELQKALPARQVHINDDPHYEEHDRSAHALSLIPDDLLKGTTLPTYEWNARTTLPLNEAIFGSVYPGQETEYARLLTTVRQRLTLSGTRFWEAQYTPALTNSVLNITSYGLHAYTATNFMDPNAFDIVLVDSFDALCMFWNFRATREAVGIRRSDGQRTLLLPSALASSRGVQTLVTFLRQKFLETLPNSNLHILFHVWTTRSLSRLKKTLPRSEELRRFSGNLSVQVFGAKAFAATDPLTYAFAYPFWPTQYLQGLNPSQHSRVAFTWGQNELTVNPPHGYRNQRGYEVMLDFESDFWKRYANDAAVAKKIHEHGWFSKYGFSLPVGLSERSSDVHLQIPRTWDTLQAFFLERGYGIRLSRHSRYAEAVIDLLGGLHNIERLSTQQTVDLLSRLATPNRKKLAQRISSMMRLSKKQQTELDAALPLIDALAGAEATRKSFEEISASTPKADRPALLRFVGTLCDVGLLKRGFHVSCPVCEGEHWWPLDSAREDLTCPGCSSSFRMPVITSKGEETRVQYALNPLIDRVMDQDGLPAILTLGQLAKLAPAGGYALGLEVLQHDHVVAELDFVILQHGRLIAGETKAGTTLEPRDLARGRFAATLGISTFYFCTPGNFTTSTIKKLASLERAVRPMRVAYLGASQLFSGQPPEFLGLQPRQRKR